MDFLRLIGILIIVVGFIFKFDTIAVVLIAALVTALVSGIPFFEFLSLMGEAFVNNRLVTLFLLTLPMIGIAERAGLRQQAVNLLEKINGITAGRLFSIYMVFRELAGTFSIRMQGQTQFVRPLIEPMSQAAATTKYGEISEADAEKIKARSAATENFGNFFAQNTFIAASGVLLITGTLESLGYTISAVDIVLATVPVALFALVVVVISNILFDRKMNRKYGRVNQQQKEGK
ncbi:DUF969 domain-containing protein [Marinilactibacillus piezotolerans]|uniref:DUF969 domain-containing protein n=1 Tax=Marinilactibacillus piezotolerans TaxID=258723 RepID=UPI0009B0BF9F|nr:DUF969 domain-containing protein [Marinilactibacillus piezotolerans]